MRVGAGASGAILALLASATLTAQRGTTNGEWRTWGGDLGVTRYAPLDQITAENFNNKLQVAWRFKTDNLGSRPDFNLQTTPLMIGGVLYASVGEHRNAVAINAATGEMLWMHRLEEGQRARRSVHHSRGAASAIGPTARAMSGSSTSPSAISWLVSMRRTACR